MKTCTLLSRPLLLVVMVVVSWAAADPLPHDSSEDDTQGLLSNNPVTSYPFHHQPFNPYIPYNPYHSSYPYNPYHPSHPYNPYHPSHPYNPYHPSRLPHYTGHVVLTDLNSMVSYVVNNDRWVDGDSSDDETDEDNLERKKRQATFGLGMNRGPYGRDYQASAGYNRRFNNGRSSLGVHGHRNWGASGRSHGFGISFSHRFRR